MESSSLEEEKIIKDIRNLFRLEKLKKETIDIAIKGIRNLFRTEKENKGIKYRITRDIRNVFRLEKKKGIKEKIVRIIRNFFEYGEEDYYKQVIVNKFQSNNYIEYKSKGNRKALSVEEYLNKVKPYVKDIIINDLKISDTWKL